MFLQLINGQTQSLENLNGADFSLTISAIQTVSHGLQNIKTVPLNKRRIWLKKVIETLEASPQLMSLESFDDASYILNQMKDLIAKDISFAPIGPCLVYGTRSSIAKRFLTVLRALHAGCTVVFLVNTEKQEAYSKLIKVLFEAGYPEASVALVTTHDADALETLVLHPSLKAIHFYGHYHEGAFLNVPSLPVFKKRIKIHWGGKNPVLFTYDAPLDAIAQLAEKSLDQNSMAEHRFHRWFVQEKNYPLFIEKLQDVIPSLLAQKRYEPPALSLYSKALNSQTKSLYQEKNWKFFESSNLALNLDFNNCSPWQQQETLGSTMTVTRYKNSAEAIKFANTTNYASAACVFSQREESAKDIGAQLTMPHVFINEIPNLFTTEDTNGLVGCGIGLDMKDSDFFTFYKNQS